MKVNGFTYLFGLYGSVYITFEIRDQHQIHLVIYIHEKQLTLPILLILMIRHMVFIIK